MVLLGMDKHWRSREKNGKKKKKSWWLVWLNFKELLFVGSNKERKKRSQERKEHERKLRAKSRGRGFTAWAAIVFLC